MPFSLSFLDALFSVGQTHDDLFCRLPKLSCPYIWHHSHALLSLLSWCYIHL